MGVQEWGGLVTVIAIGISLIGWIAVHVLPTRLNPLRDPVSQYHLTRFRPWIAVSTLAAALAGVAAIFAVSPMLGAGAIVCDILLGLFALARLLIPFLRMDPPGTPTTAVGRVHNILAFVAFGAATALGFVAGGALHDSGHPDAATWSTVFGSIAAVGAVGLLITVTTRRRGLFGLFERLIYVGFFAWFLLIGFTALR